MSFSLADGHIKKVYRKHGKINPSGHQLCVLSKSAPVVRITCMKWLTCLIFLHLRKGTMNQVPLMRTTKVRGNKKALNANSSKKVTKRLER